MIVSDFYCTICARRGIPIIRKPGKQKEAGHLKKLFCLYCQKETNHVEIRSNSSYTLKDFEEEFELGRFVDGNRIPVSELMICSNINCKYNKNKRCWNSNYSYDCGHRIKE